MIEHCLRLKRGTDIKKSIENYCKDQKIDTAIVLCAVGCVLKYHIRLAKAIDSIENEEQMEIIALIGTISKGKAHLHIGLSDDKGKMIGGHLKEGTLVDTTLELVLGELEGYKSERLFDEETGYDEIVFVKRDF